MSNYSSPNPHKLCAAMPQRPPAMLQTPPASADLHRSGDWISDQHHHHHHHHHHPPSGMPAPMGYWQPHEARGLGLSPLPPSSHPTDQMYHDSMVAAHSASMPFAWPAEFIDSSHAPVPHHAPMKKDSLIDSCDPSSTLLPSGAVWDALQHSSAPGPLTYDASPSLSSYSTSSRLSAMSSPYAGSDGYLKAGVSPPIKLETALEHTPIHIHALPEQEPLDQSLLVTPGDLVTAPPSLAGNYVSATILSSNYDHALRSECDDDDQHHHHTPPRQPSASPPAEEPREGRRKRSFTKPENANCACDICGKLFQRIYNLKAHMETHDPQRNHPHPCQYDGCDKKFVRRTDRMRHEQSVHLKARNYSCPRCDNSFARKDTLRRHVDDGCTKRPEVRPRAAGRGGRRSSNHSNSNSNSNSNNNNVAAAVASPASRRQSIRSSRDGTTAPSPLGQPAHFPG